MFDEMYSKLVCKYCGLKILIKDKKIHLLAHERAKKLYLQILECKTITEIRSLLKKKICIYCTKNNVDYSDMKFMITPISEPLVYEKVVNNEYFLLFTHNDSDNNEHYFSLPLTVRLRDMCKEFEINKIIAEGTKEIVDISLLIMKLKEANEKNELEYESKYISISNQLSELISSFIKNLEPSKEAILETDNLIELCKETGEIIGNKVILFYSIPNDNLKLLQEKLKIAYDSYMNEKNKLNEEEKVINGIKYNNVNITSKIDYQIWNLCQKE